MMENYEPIMSFGEDAAEIYDAEPDVGQRGDTLATVSFLEHLAGGGPALELAIGTGRVALPLAARFLNPFLMRDYLHVDANKQAGLLMMDTVGKGPPAFLMLGNGEKVG